MGDGPFHSATAPFAAPMGWRHRRRFPSPRRCPIVEQGRFLAPAPSSTAEDKAHDADENAEDSLPLVGAVLQAASDLGGRTRHLHCSVPAAAARGTANPTDQIDHQEHDHGHEQRKMNRREELMRLNYVLK
ncbi:hypothetical protein PVAP13_2NG618101 [Panicum virgatum]|uniref:Uncharacterized protein n=1 Tax=Panicum virgatum TaxID=38727 RepID=A0A8T0VXL0_PANVG|nr:hypothetical protein PVAP13_2NG618101 [Panicum virgatum]